MGTVVFIGFGVAIVAIALFGLIKSVEKVALESGGVTRLVVGYFLPLLLGSLFVTIFDKFISSGLQSRGNFYELFFALLVISSILTSIPAVLYSYLMERYVNTSDNSHIIVILMSIFMGGLSGILLIGLVYIGMIVGLVSGVVLRVMFMQSTKSVS